MFTNALLGREARVRLIGGVSLQSRQVGANNTERLSRGENRRHRVNDLLPCRAHNTISRVKVKASRVLRERWLEKQERGTDAVRMQIDKQGKKRDLIYMCVKLRS